MNKLITRTVTISFLFAFSGAFTPLRPIPRSATTVFESAAESSKSLEASAELGSQQEDLTSATPPPAALKETKEEDAKGLFAPAVLLTKDIIGVTELNKLRAKIINLHSDVIGKFTDTAQTEFGNQVLKVLFTLADKNGDGTIDEEELREALKALGFDFLKESQIAGIFKRADGDKNGTLDFEEWEKAAPKTLKSSLIKLAKKNGHDLGFLA